MVESTSRFVSRLTLLGCASALGLLLVACAGQPLRIEIAQGHDLERLAIEFDESATHLGAERDVGDVFQIDRCAPRGRSKRNPPQIVERVDVPVYLAGGLDPANVRDAMATVSPHGLDLCTGVRTHGKLDPQKLAAFFAAVR